MRLLSIICPFYNSIKKCDRLLETLGKITDSQVELILIDDGSSDETYNLLKEFKNKAQCNTIIATQENKGPGGARNHGLILARSKYVWFIDSDDDVYLNVIEQLKELAHKNYDFIDFNLKSKSGIVNSMSVIPGEYTDKKNARELLITNFGRICTKIIRRELITTHNIFYPEHCIYEDNPLMLIYPFYVDSFYKSDVTGYIHHEDFESITRSNPGPRFFDRITTITHGAKIGLSLTTEKTEKDRIESKFLQIFLLNTIPALIKQFNLTGIILAARVMRYYREKCTILKIEISPFRSSLLEKKSKWLFLYNLIFRTVWVASYALPSQECFFEKKHLSCWGHPIKYLN